MFYFEERVLIGWLANTMREPANQDTYRKVQHFCFYVKVFCHFRPEYNYRYFHAHLELPHIFDRTIVQKWIGSINDSILMQQDI